MGSGASIGRLDVELAEQGNSARDPVFLWLCAGNHHRDNEVCGMSGRRQRTSSLAGLVDRRHVDRFVWNVGTSARLEPDGWQDVEQDAWVRFVELAELTIPACAVDEQAVDVRAVIWRLFVLLYRYRSIRC